MLVLSRKKGRSIVLNDNIEIVIVDIQKDVVRLGINAPKEVSVYRREIYEEILKENQMASKVDEGTLKKVIENFKSDKKN